MRRLLLLTMIAFSSSAMATWPPQYCDFQEDNADIKVHDAVTKITDYLVEHGDKVGSVILGCAEKDFTYDLANGIFLPKGTQPVFLFFHGKIFDQYLKRHVYHFSATEYDGPFGDEHTLVDTKTGEILSAPICKKSGECVGY